MWPAFAAFLFGFLAGFVMLRLGRNKPLSEWERRVLRPVGWALMTMSLTFAFVLFGWAVLIGGKRSTPAIDPVPTLGTTLMPSR